MKSGLTFGTRPFFFSMYSSPVIQPVKLRICKMSQLLFYLKALFSCTWLFFCVDLQGFLPFVNMFVWVLLHAQNTATVEQISNCCPFFSCTSSIHMTLFKDNLIQDFLFSNLNCMY